MSREQALELLRQQKEAGKSQTRIADEVGVSPAAISLLLKGTYPGDIEAMCERIISAYSSDEVYCHALAERITVRDCAEWCRKPFAATNPQRVRMFRACRECPNRRG